MPITLIKLRAPLRYSDGWDLQKVHAATLEGGRERHAKLLLLQHLPVFTLGRSTQPAHLLCSEHDLAVRTGADVVRVDRGGSVTYHGPGQLTGYLLLNLQAWGLGIHQHLDMLEETVIQALGSFGVSSRREPGMTGVWTGSPNPAKVCAIGVSARKWVTYHGFSLNVDLDLKPFLEVVPCGLNGKPVTTSAEVLGRSVCVTDVENALTASMAAVYGEPTELGMV